MKAAGQKPEVRKARAESAKTQWQNPEIRRKHLEAITPEYRCKLSEAHKAAWVRGAYEKGWRQKMSEIMSAKWEDPEFLQKWTDAHSEAVQSPEFRQRMSENMVARWANPEAREVIYESLMRVWEDPEFRQRLSDMMTAQWQDSEFRQKQAEAWTPEARQRQAEAWAGENNPNWRGGLSLEPYGPDFSDELKAYIRSRDSYRCAVCNVAEDGHAHHCHHLDYNKANNDPSNLITLCRPCHSRTNTNRRFWRTILAPVARRREAA